MIPQIVLTVIVIILIFVLHNKLTTIKDAFFNQPPPFEEMLMGNDISSSRIPNTVWTYWDDDCPPELIMGFIKTWIDHNPNYQIIVLTEKNYTRYIPALPENNPILDSPQHKSDFVRLSILSTYGGIWMDASIFCTMSLSWIHTIQTKTDSELVGYFMPNFTTMDEYPVIENWFISCTPNSELVKDWFKELNVAISQPHIDNYIEKVRKDGISLQKIDGPEYLWMHVALQKVIQSKPVGHYRFKVLNATNGPFAYLSKKEWNSRDAIVALAESKTPLNPIVKFRGIDRRVLAEDSKIADKVMQRFGVTDYVVLKESNICKLKRKTDGQIILSIE